MTKKDYAEFYREWVNNYLTVEKMAEHKNLPIWEVKYLINLGKIAHDNGH